MNRFSKWLRTGREAILHNALGTVIGGLVFLALTGSGAALFGLFGDGAKGKFFAIALYPVRFYWLALLIVANVATVGVLWKTRKQHLEKIEQLEKQEANRRKEKKPGPPPRRSRWRVGDW